MAASQSLTADVGPATAAASAASATATASAQKTVAGWVSRGLSCAMYAAYDVLVRKPLRLFYFQVIHDGRNPEDICAEDSKYPASFYTSSPENMAACQQRLDAMFKSWDVAALTVVHFSLLTFITIRVILCLTCANRRGGGRHHHRDYDYDCDCGPCNHHGGGSSADRMITVDDLRRMIEAASAARQGDPAGGVVSAQA